MTDEQEALIWEGANLLYQAMRIKVGPERAHTASIMWDELTRRHAKIFTPTLMRPAQVKLVSTLRAIAARKLAEQWTTPHDRPDDVGRIGS